MWSTYRKLLREVPLQSQNSLSFHCRQRGGVTGGITQRNISSQFRNLHTPCFFFSSSSSFATNIVRPISILTPPSVSGLHLLFFPPRFNINDNINNGLILKRDLHNSFLQRGLSPITRTNPLTPTSTSTQISLNLPTINTTSSCSFSDVIKRWSSTMKKRRSKMNKHKLKKRRKLMRNKTGRNL